MADGTLGTSSLRGEDTAPVQARLAIMAFVNDTESEVALRQGLEDFIPQGIEIRRMSCGQATAQLRRMPTPRVLIVDVSGEEHPMSALADLSEVVEPDVRVLVIGDRQDMNFYRQVTRGFGVLEYLYKPLVRSMVSRHFGPCIGSGGGQSVEAAHGGRVISITGASGGAGATTVATNLAWHFANDIRRHTLLLDPNLQTGAMALMLGVKGDTGLRSALEFPDRVDELFLERSAQSVSDRLAVLSSEEALTEQPIIAPGAVQHLLTTLKRRYNFVIVDAAFRPLPLNRDLIDLSHQRVLVMDATLASMRDAMRLLALPSGPVQSRRALLVLNRLGQPGTLSLQQIERGMGLSPDVIIPYSPRLVAQAAITAKAAVTTKGAFRSSILALAKEAAFVRALEDDAPAGPSQRAGWRRRLSAPLARAS